jgi:hypothetical protein
MATMWIGTTFGVGKGTVMSVGGRHKEGNTYFAETSDIPGVSCLHVCGVGMEGATEQALQTSSTSLYPKMTKV